MLHEQHGGGRGADQLFDLHPGVDVDEVEGLVPDVEVGFFAEAPGQQDLLFLPAGKAGHVLFKLDPGEIHLPQDGLEQALVQAVGPGKAGQVPRKAGGVLGDIRDHQPGGAAHLAGVGDVLAAEQLEQAGFAGAVAAVQGHPLPLPDRKGEGPADRPPAVPDLHVLEQDQGVGVVQQGGDPQVLGGLGVFQQGGLFLDGLLLAGLDGLGPLHHLGGLVAHIALVGGALFAGLHPVGPEGGAPGRLLQPLDVLAQALVLGFFQGLPLLEVGKPGGKVPALDLDAGPVEGQDVVHAPVQEPPVVGHQDEALLFLQVGRHHGPGLGVQVVGGLVDEQEVPLVQKQGGQQHLGLLAVGQAGKGAVQRVGPHPQQGQLPLQLPALRAGAHPLQHRAGGAARVGDGVGEIVEGHRGPDGAGVFVPAHKQLEKRGLAPAVAADEAQLPAGVQPEAHVLKDGVVAGRIGKRQMFDLDQCQGASLLCTKTGRRKSPAAVCAQSSPAAGGGQALKRPFLQKEKEADGMGHFLQAGAASPSRRAARSLRSAGKMTHPSTPFV